MLTYVINTSENKSFDSEKLFDLAGYNKVRWYKCPLNDIKRCAESIFEKQNVLGAEKFRIAVIVDFYNFDRIRQPYGRRGYTEDAGVDLCLYVPYIEIYLLDNLIGYLENNDLFACDFEIFYVQSEKCEHYDLLENAKGQVAQILEGCGEFTSKQRQIEQVSEDQVSVDGIDPDDFITFERKRTQKEIVEITENYYKSFSLYCTKNVSLVFDLNNYPYGDSEMTFDQFWVAFRQRASIPNKVRNHYYVTSYGSGPSRIAFETLSLSLYLIRMYEREEMSDDYGDMDLIRLDGEVLKDILEKAWQKINIARISAKKSSMSYYSLSQNFSSIDHDISNIDSLPSPKDAISAERAKLPSEITDTKMSANDLYSEIKNFSTRRSNEIKNRNQVEFDSIMSDYLKKRDVTRVNNTEDEFKTLRDLGALTMTDQSPSKDEYIHLVHEKQHEISNVFEKVLTAEYIDVDYSEQRKKADEAYSEYKQAKAWMHGNILGDIIFMILAVTSMIVPYSLLQLTSIDSKVISSLILGLIASGIFTGLFICSVIFCVLPLAKKMSNARYKLKKAYIECNAMEKYSFSAIKRRYEKDLIQIEHIRYDIRQIKRLYEANRVKDKNIESHRKMLEDVEDCIASMLNNLDVSPKFDSEERIDGEFDINKPIRSGENKIYQVFSIETIEKMFPKKGSDKL